MIVDLSLSAQSIILLMPLMAGLSFLFTVVAPWIYNKVSQGFLGGVQMDPRGPGGARYQPSSRGGTHQTKYGKDSPGSGNYGGYYGSDYGGSYGGGYRGNHHHANPRSDDYARRGQSQYFYQYWNPPQPDVVDDDSDSDDEDDDDDDNDSDSD